MNNPIRILLVDDSRHFLDAACDYLHLHERFMVIGVANQWEEAVARCEELQPDLILLDLNLGNRSGLDLIPLFKAKLPQARIIVLTVLEEICYRNAALQAGADAFIRKTYMTETIVPAIFALADRSLGQSGVISEQ